MTNAQARTLRRFKDGARYPLQGRGSYRTAESLKRLGLIDFVEVHVIDTIFRLDAWLTEKGREYVRQLDACGFCGSTEPFIEEQGDWPKCQHCGGV